jgi:hypothetical protein
MTTGLGAVLVLLSIPAGFLALAGFFWIDWPLMGLASVVGLPIAAMWQAQRLANRRPGGV